MKNYRLLSPMSIWGKVMEKITRKHRPELLSSAVLFQTIEKVVCQGVLPTMYDWAEELDNKNEFDNVCIVFQKTFDSVPHERLFGTIDKYVVQGKIPNWIRNFLLGSERRVVINKSFSKSQTVRSGFPEVSVRGPVFFVVSIKWSFNWVFLRLYFYAFDTNN